LPTTWKVLRALKTLVLSFNTLSGPLPSEVMSDGLKALQVLALDHNPGPDGLPAEGDERRVERSGLRLHTEPDNGSHSSDWFLCHLMVFETTSSQSQLDHGEPAAVQLCI